jgi:hypothetical protein
MAEDPEIHVYPNPDSGSEAVSAGTPEDLALSIAPGAETAASPAVKLQSDQPST